MPTLDRDPFKSLFVSFRGQLKKDNNWVIFDNFYYNNEDELCFTGFDLFGKEIIATSDEIYVSESNIDYSIDFLNSKFVAMEKALNALKKIKNSKEN